MHLNTISAKLSVGPIIIIPILKILKPPCNKKHGGFNEGIILNIFSICLRLFRAFGI